MIAKIRALLARRRNSPEARSHPDGPTPGEYRDSIANDPYTGAVRRGQDDRSGPFQRM